MKKILLLTVPHTGTVFTCDYLREILGLKHYQGMNRGDAEEFINTEDTNVFARIHTTSPTKLAQEGPNSLLDYAINNCNVISTLRPPIDNAISCVIREHSNLVYCASCWDIMIEMTPKYNVFWLDTHAKKETRRNMIEQLNTFLDCQPKDIDKFNNFIDGWEKVGEGKKFPDIKQAYIDEGTLPKGYDFSSLDFAVHWYDDMKIKLDKQYSMPLPMD